MSNRMIGFSSVLTATVAVLLGWWALRGAGEPELRANPEVGGHAVKQRGPGTKIAAPRDDGSIAGAVLARDELGKSVPGARVCVWPVDVEQRRVLELSRGRCVASGPDGRYRVDSLGPGRYRVTAGAAGKLPGVWTDAAHDDRPWLLLGAGEERIGIDLALADGGVPLAGTVTDVAGGPVEGAIVVASGPGLFEREPVATGITDASGRFSMSVRGGEYRLRSEAPGYAPAAGQARAPNEAVELRLIPESVLVGRVIDESGEAVAGATVIVEPRRSHPAAVTDEHGRFRLGGLTPGIYQPAAIGEGVYGQAAMPIHVALGRTSEPIELTVHAAFRVAGRILAHDLRSDEVEGCVGGEVYLRGGGFWRSGHADEQGFVVLDGLPAGRHDLAIHCPGATEPKRATLELLADVEDQRWELDVGGFRIAGRVVDASGRGVEGIFVEGLGPGGDSLYQSGSEGEFELLVRERGAYVVTAKFRGQRAAVATREVEVSDDVEGVELEVGEVASLRGRVIDGEGRAVAGARVALCDAQVRCRHRANSDGEGNFGFDALPLGRMWAALDDDLPRPGRATEPVGEPVEIVAGGITEVTLVTELATGSIRGTVSAEGGPVDDAWVVAARGGVDALVRDWEVGPVLCEVDGSFVLDGLGEGSWAVRAFRRDGGEASVADIELGSTIALELVATASVAGRVRLVGGEPPSLFEIEAQSGEHRRRASFYRSDGEFALRELPAGEWHLKVMAASGSAELDVELEPGDLVDDLDIELEPRVTIRGRVVDSRTREPLSSVELRLQQGGFGRNAQPDADGRFELDGVPPGRVALVATPRNWRRGGHRMQFPVVDVEAEPTVQDVGEVELAGSRLGDDEALGDLGFTIEISGFGDDLSEVDARYVRVRSVRAGGPAEAAGLRRGDVIVSIDGVSVEGRRAAHAHAYLKVAAGDAVVVARREAAEVTIVALAPDSVK